jgi:hypothetical protein
LSLDLNQLRFKFLLLFLFKALAALLN